MHALHAVTAITLEVLVTLADRAVIASLPFRTARKQVLGASAAQDAVR